MKLAHTYASRSMQNHRLGRDTLHGAGGQGGDDVSVAEWEGEITGLVGGMSYNFGWVACNK